MAPLESKAERPLVLKRWEFGVLLVETIIAGAALLTVFLVALPRLLEGGFRLPSGVWAAGGFFALFWAIVPLLNVYARSSRGRGLPLMGVLGASLAAAAVGGAVFALLI